MAEYRSSTRSSSVRSSWARVASLSSQTFFRPTSMVSTMSAWCRASRAAHEMAREGVASAEVSKWCGRVEERAATSGGRIFSTTRAKCPVKLHTAGHHQVEQQVKQHHLGTDIGHQRGNVGQPGLDQPDHGHHADHLEQQVAQRHLAHLHTGFERGQQGQHAAAQVGPQHQPQGHIARNAARAGQGRPPAARWPGWSKK